MQNKVAYENEWLINVCKYTVIPNSYKENYRLYPNNHVSNFENNFKKNFGITNMWNR